MTPLELAESYTAKGWPVFPTRSAPEDVVDQTTGEVTEYKVKTPHTARGLKDASASPHVVKAWFGRKHPDAMVGIPTGAPIGAWVLDIDPKDGGYETLASLEAANDDLPDTRTASTPSGGRHYYFKHTPGVRNRGALGLGVDVRGEGGYVVAPGSMLADGRGYSWDNDNDILPAPDWLLQLVVRRDPPAQHANPPRSSAPTAYVNAAVDAELADLSSTPMGNRNNQLNDSAFALGTLVAAGGLSEHEARDLLQDVARGWGRDWSQCAKTIENGLSAGMKQPRVIPEPDFPEHDNTRLVDVKRMIANGLAKASQPEPTAEDEVPSGPLSPIVATSFSWLDPKKLPRREFVYGKHLIRKYVSVTSAPGGLGKTSLSIAEAVAMASGRDLLGIKPSKRLRVWLFNAEDPRDELERRIMAACLHYGLRPADVEGHLFIDTGREQQLCIAVEDKKTGVRIMQPIVEAVVAEIKRHEIDVMCIDPFVSTHGVNENDNGAVDKVAKLWAQIADDTNCAIDVVHHVKKTGDREATVEDSRGAVSLLAAARSARILNRMTPEQETSFGLAPGQRFSYFSVGYGKSNLSPASGDLEWRHLVSVPLGNGQGASKPQDHAAVVTAWQPRTAAEVAEEISAEQLAAIKVAVDNGTCRESDQAADWAGREVALVLRLDIEDKAVKRRVKSLLKVWTEDGHFKAVQLMDPVRKTAKMFLKSNEWEAA